MDEFSYLSVLLAIILGLAITQILKGFRGLLHARYRVIMYWPVLVWAILLLVIYVQSWWALFSLRTLPIWTFGEFAVVLLQSILLYMLAALVLPDFFNTGQVDLRKHYFAQARWFFVIAALAGVLGISKDLVITGALPSGINLMFQSIFIAGTIGGAFVQSDRYHKLLAPFMAFGFICYVLILFARLQ